MRFDEELPTAILGQTVRTLEASGEEATEETLFEAVERKGIERRMVKEFLEKAARGKKRGHYLGFKEKL